MRTVDYYTCHQLTKIICKRSYEANSCSSPIQIYHFLSSSEYNHLRHHPIFAGSSYYSVKGGDPSIGTSFKMESLRPQTNFQFGEADTGAGVFPGSGLTIDVEASRVARSARNNDAFLNSNDINLLENLLHSPVSAMDIKPTVKPAETWNGNADPLMFESTVALPEKETSLLMHQGWAKQKVPSHRERWGQITPCTDDSSDVQSPRFSDHTDHRDDNMDVPVLTSNSSTRRMLKKPQGTRSRQSSLTSPSPKNTNSNNSRASKHSQNSTSPQEEDVKRERFLK